MNKLIYLPAIVIVFLLFFCSANAQIDKRIEKEPESNIDYIKIEAANALIWNEKDEAVRKVLITKLYAPDVKFVDPYSISNGIEGVNNFISTLQKQYPSFSFATDGMVLGHHDMMKVNWNFGPKESPKKIQGSDVVIFKAGLIQTYYVFLQR